MILEIKNKKLKQVLLIVAMQICLLFLNVTIYAQQKDSAIKKPIIFSGSLGFSSNGFSIVPTFSLNSPATMVQLSWKKNKFSIEPDIRLTPDAKRGSMLLWFRYNLINNKKYNFRVGVHPAINFQTREITTNTGVYNISQMRRFFAWETSNQYTINKNLGVGLYYLQGNGLQSDGARTTHFVSLNTAVSKIAITKTINLTVAPSIYYLYLDGSEGTYCSGSVIIAHSKLPFTLQHAFNKTITSNIPGNKDYMWNISIHYNFKKTYKPV